VIYAITDLYKKRGLPRKHTRGKRNIRRRKYIHGGIPVPFESINEHLGLLELTNDNENPPVKITLTLDTDKTTQESVMAGTTGSIAYYKDNTTEKCYLVKLMYNNGKHDIPNKFNIEVGILKHLNAKYKTDTESITKAESIKFFPKYAASEIVKIQKTQTHEIYAIATEEECDNGKYTELFSFIFPSENGFKKIDESVFIEIAQQLCKGLSILHKADVYHRDIKAENVVINPNTHQIMYIGFNGCYWEPVYKKLGFSTTILHANATSGYIHPESITEYIKDPKQSIINRSFGKVDNLYKYDYWALANLLYFLKYGEMPLDEMYYGEDTLAIMRKKKDYTTMAEDKILYINAMTKYDYYTTKPNIFGFGFGSGPFSPGNYEKVYNKMRALDKILVENGCATLAQLMKPDTPIENLYNGDKFGVLAPIAGEDDDLDPDAD
jgi:serine/threonine protein kinase